MSEEIQVPQIDVALPPSETTVRVTEEEAEEEITRLGLIKVKSKEISGLAKIGIFTKGAGVFPIQRGKLLITQIRHKELMDQITAVVGDIMADKSIKSKDKIKLLEVAARSQAVLARVETEAARAMTDMAKDAAIAPVGTPLEQDEPLNQAFTRGKDVKLLIQTKEAHFHESTNR